MLPTLSNVEWWFDEIIQQTSDFDFIGISYYPLWHTGVQFHQLEDRIREFRERFNKEIIILETAYPWTTDGADNYNNLFGGENPISGYAFTLEGQTNYLIDLTKALKNCRSLRIGLLGACMDYLRYEGSVGYRVLMGKQYIFLILKAMRSAILTS